MKISSSEGSFKILKEEWDSGLKKNSKFEELPGRRKPMAMFEDEIFEGNGPEESKR